jgi:hypothetical protein
VAPPPLAGSLPGLASVAAGESALQVRWRTPPAGHETALYVGTDRDTLRDGPPLVEGPGGTTLLLEGLDEDTTYFVGLGLREVGDPAWVPVGRVLTASTGAPIHVSADADPSVADGRSPATAFDDVARGLLTALTAGGGNVWIAGGEYEVAHLPLLAGVHVQGGFDADFELARRDPAAHATIWRAAPGATAVGVQGDGPAAILDGLRISGGSGGAVGVDVIDATVELRDVTVEGFADRGVRVRDASSDENDITLLGCSVSSNGADGLSVSGAVDVFLEGSVFANNVQEGVELDPLFALEGELARLRVRDCRFAGNGTEGLDADLAAPVGSVPGAASFDVRIEGSRFERNGADGMLIDIDYEGVVGWHAAIEVRGSSARANRGSGFHLDVDAPADVLLHRIRSTANAGDGVLITSESDPGVVSVSTSVATGNLGAGLRSALGNRSILASHCVLAGNAAGGIVGDVVPNSAASVVFHHQPNAHPRTHVAGGVEESEAAVRVFERAPAAYLRIDARDGDHLAVSDTAALGSGATVEVADDGTARTAVTVSGVGLTLDRSPSRLEVPGVLSVFPDGSGVREDFTLAAGSPALRAGLSMRDAGPWGAALAGEPGEADPLASDLFRPLSSRPAAGQLLGATQDVEILFSSSIDPLAVDLDSVGASGTDGSPLAVTTMVVDDRLIIGAPAGGWGTTDVVVELHDGLSSLDGRRLHASTLLPFERAAPARTH